MVDTKPKPKTKSAPKPAEKAVEPVLIDLITAQKKIRSEILKSGKGSS